MWNKGLRVLISKTGKIFIYIFTVFFSFPQSRVRSPTVVSSFHPEMIEHGIVVSQHLRVGNLKPKIKEKSLFIIIHPLQGTMNIFWYLFFAKFIRPIWKIWMMPKESMNSLRGSRMYTHWISVGNYETTCTWRKVGSTSNPAWALEPPFS